MFDVNRSVLQASGAPENLVQFVTGFGEAGAALIENVDKVIFVGSVAVGKKVRHALACCFAISRSVVSP